MKKLLNKNRFKDFNRDFLRLLRTQSFYRWLLFFIVLFAILFANTLHESYPDEMDNILGGWYILQGQIIYKSFFTHHGPASYFIAAIIEIFSGNSFVNFRYVYSFALFSYLLFLFVYFRRSVGVVVSNFIPLTLLFIAVSSTYFWGHMLLADNIAAFLLAPAIFLIIIKRLYKLPLTVGDTILVSVFSIIALLSSLTYSYLIMILYAVLVLEYVRSNHLSFVRPINFLKPVLIVIVPYVVFVLYLIVTGSFQDYIYQAIVFNQKYYIYNYPRADGQAINPIRFAIIILKTFTQTFSDLLVQVKDFNFYFPFNIALAVSNVVLMLYLFVRRQYMLVFFVFLMLVFANSRSNPNTSGERDYQSAVYIMLSLFASCFAIYELLRSLKNDVEYRKKMIFTALFLLVFVYTFFNFFFLARKFMYKTYDKYMGTAPLIYDRPQIAPIINSLLADKDDYTWIGPFEFEELIYTQNPIASRYQIFNPGMGKSGVIEEELISDFERTKPKVIWFDKRFHILGNSPEDFGQNFIRYIDAHYVTIYNYRIGDSKYVSVKPIDQKTDIETKIYIRRENVDEIVKRMVEQGHIREVKAQ